MPADPSAAPIGVVHSARKPASAAPAAPAIRAASLVGAADQTSAPSLNAILQYTFFNRAPKVNAVQTGQTPDGVITGDLNASGPAGAVLTYQVTPDPLGQRAAVVNPDGSYTFTDSLFTQPGLFHAAGPDSFTVTVDDGSAYRLSGPAGAVQRVLHSLAQAIGLSGPDAVQVEVGVTFAAINHPPVAVADNFSTNENTGLTGNVLANDTDFEGDTLTAVVSGAPAHGNITLNADGSFSYNPATDFYGGDAFSYTVSDGWGGSAVGTANITVNYVAPPTPPPPSGPTLSQKIDAFVQAFQGKVWGQAAYGTTPYTNPASLTNDTSSPYYTPDLVGECVSLITQYLKYVYNITPPKTGLGDANQWAKGGSGGNYMQSQGFIWHSASDQAQNGDILVFSSVHIGIYYNGQLFDANDATSIGGRNVDGFGGWAARHAGFANISAVAGYVGFWRAPGGTTAQYPTGTVMATTQRMAAATLNSQQLGTYGVGTTLSLVCYARGQSVKGYYSYAISGGYDNLWYQTTDGGFAADVDINTGSDNPVTNGC
jgi:hypothetical protein